MSFEEVCGGGRGSGEGLDQGRRSEVGETGREFV